MHTKIRMQQGVVSSQSALIFSGITVQILMIHRESFFSLQALSVAAVALEKTFEKMLVSEIPFKMEGVHCILKETSVLSKFWLLCLHKLLRQI